MSLFEAVILGIIQGLTEFIPISSTAHLRILPAIAGWQDPGAAFSAIIQTGTLAAVLIYFYRDIVRISGAFFRETLAGKPFETQESKMGWMIGAGTIPIICFGLLFKSAIETSLRSLYWIGAALILLALFLTLAEWRMKRQAAKGRRAGTMKDIGWKQALLIGFAQAIALVPGSSRSGVTITAGLFLNLSRETAARFSFLLSLPAVFAAGIYQLYDQWSAISTSTESMTNLAAATLSAGVVGYASIAFLLNFLRKHSTGLFIVYRILLGFLVLGLLSAGLLPA